MKKVGLVFLSLVVTSFGLLLFSLQSQAINPGKVKAEGTSLVQKVHVIFGRKCTIKSIRCRRGCRFKCRRSCARTFGFGTPRYYRCLRKCTRHCVRRCAIIRKKCVIRCSRVHRICKRLWSHNHIRYHRCMARRGC